MSTKPEQNWSNATWIASRRAMIRQSLKLTIRERLQALEDLCETAQPLSRMKIRHKQGNHPLSPGKTQKSGKA